VEVAAVLHSEVGTAAIIYSTFNKQSKFRLSLRPADRGGSTLAALATPLHPRARQAFRCARDNGDGEVKSLEIDLPSLFPRSRSPLRHAIRLL